MDKVVIERPCLHARCTNCGYVGDRTFRPDQEGLLRDVLGGPHGITPKAMLGSTCGGCKEVAPWELVVVLDHDYNDHPLMRAVRALSYVMQEDEQRNLMVPHLLLAAIFNVCHEGAAPLPVKKFEPPTGTTEAIAHLVMEGQKAGMPPPDHNRTLLYHRERKMEEPDDDRR